jgi:8-oxo-dGTP pyrophosphatase MutT (NUDIX family)
MSNNNLIQCNNCNKKGHLFHQCKIPITSIGIIAFRIINNNIEILLIRRKDSLAFVDFMRGKYNLDNPDYIINLFNNMSIFERTFILNNNFNMLWSYLWGNEITNQYKNEEKISKYKFNQLKDGYISNNININLNYIIDKCNVFYTEPEWGFPKGRRNFQEKDIKCGLREFEEETGYNINNFIIINNLLPFEEIFTGSNYKSYKHKYFLAYVNNKYEPDTIFQINEVSKIEWVPIDIAHKYIRNNNYEKQKIIFNLNKLLKTYKLYI